MGTLGIGSEGSSLKALAAISLSLEEKEELVLGSGLAFGELLVTAGRYTPPGWLVKSLLPLYSLLLILCGIPFCLI